MLTKKSNLLLSKSQKLAIFKALIFHYPNAEAIKLDFKNSTLQQDHIMDSFLHFYHVEATIKHVMSNGEHEKVEKLAILPEQLIIL